MKKRSEVISQGASVPATPGLAEMKARALMLKENTDAASEAMNQGLDDGERLLIELGFSQRCTVDISSDADEAAGEELGLEFGLLEKLGWRLYLRRSFGDFTKDDRTTLLTNASRETRMRAANAFPELLRVVLEAAEKQFAELERAANAIGTQPARVLTPVAAQPTPKVTPPQDDFGGGDFSSTSNDDLSF